MIIDSYDNSIHIDLGVLKHDYYIIRKYSLETPTRHCSVGSGASQNIQFNDTSKLRIKNIYLYNNNFKKLT